MPKINTPAAWPERIDQQGLLHGFNNIQPKPAMKFLRKILDKSKHAYFICS